MKPSQSCGCRSPAENTKAPRAASCSGESRRGPSAARDRNAQATAPPRAQRRKGRTRKGEASWELWPRTLRAVISRLRGATVALTVTMHMTLRRQKTS